MVRIFYKKTSPIVSGSGSHVHDYLASLIAWTKIIPQFESLKRDDQVYLVQSAWNEITIADIAHKSIDYEVCKILTKAFFQPRTLGCPADWKERIIVQRASSFDTRRSYI